MKKAAYCLYVNPILSNYGMLNLNIEYLESLALLTRIIITYIIINKYRVLNLKLFWSRFFCS